MRQLPQIDQVLKAATDGGEVPGVVAMAATREGRSIRAPSARASCPTGRR
jgi:hypothetical protein